ncbi:MAG TPA: hypothetical protein VMY40_02950, partial [Anaerolineae bacterium]|nr:hypothetical protein [Anaerolineae bacterium]
SVFAEFVADAAESESMGIDYAPQFTPADAKTRSAYRTVHLAWTISGVLSFLVLLLGALLVWQAPTFVQHCVSYVWGTAQALSIGLGQVGDASGGLVVIVVVLSIAVVGIKERKRIRQILDDLWDRLLSLLM